MRAHEVAANKVKIASRFTAESYQDHNKIPAPEPFGKWIKRNRRAKGLGLWRCAGKAHLGGEALRLIETGKSNPADCKVKTLYGLAVVLGLDLAEVIERAVGSDGEYMYWLAQAQELIR